MQILTLQVALSSLSFLYESPTLRPNIETIKEFDNAWKANLNLVVTMSIDTKMAKKWNTADWKKLNDAASQLNGNSSPSIFFYVLKKILGNGTVEAMVKTYPEYPVALMATKELAIAITEQFRNLDIPAEHWKRLLAVTRMETTPTENVKCLNTTSCKAVCDKQLKGNGKYLELVNTDQNELRTMFRNLTPTSTDSALTFLKMVHILNVPFLSNKSSKYLERVLSMTNVVQIYQTAIRYKMKDLKRKAQDFIFWEFEDISKKDKNFFSLKVNELLSLLMSNKINVPNEISVFAAIERWVMADPNSRKRHVTILMKAIRPHLCSISQLYMIWDHQLLVGLDSVKQSIRSAIDLVKVKSKNLPALVKKEQRNLDEILFVVGGHGTGQSSITLETFSTSTKHWKYHPSLNYGKKGWTSAVTVGKNIIVFDHARFKVSSFDPIKKKWKFLSNVPNKRLHYGLAVLNGEIYALVGWKDNKYTNICERFNPSTGVWTKIPYLNSAKGYVAAASLKGKIYLAAGFNDGPLSTFDMFDPERNLWYSLTSLKTARFGLALVTEGDYLWAFGGSTFEYKNLYSVERYDPDAGTWTNMPAMPTTKNHPQVVFMSGSFYAIGGTEDAVRSRVDVFNPRKKTWTKTSNMQFGRYQLGACVVKDLPNAYDYA